MLFQGFQYVKQRPRDDTNILNSHYLNVHMIRNIEIIINTKC